MRRYLVVAHRTLGGAHLYEHLHELRERDSFCRFHLLVPRYHPRDHPWSEAEVVHAAQTRVDEIVADMATMGMGATGEVGDANPVTAIGDTLRREGADAFAGIVVSTLPAGRSPWLRASVPKRIARSYPTIPVTHLIADPVPASG